MTHSPYTILPFEPPTLSDKDLARLHRLHCEREHEFWREDPLPDLAATKRLWAGRPAFFAIHAWWAMLANSDDIIGTGYVLFWQQVSHNQHLGLFDIYVHPDHRRQGVGKQLMAAIAGKSQELGRRLLAAKTDSIVPAGHLFMQRMGGTSAQDQSIYQLNLDDVDCNLLQQWQDQAQERAHDFTLGFWHGDYPEKDMEAIVSMKNVMNSAPSDALDMDFALTAEQLRHEEAALIQRGVQRWTMYVQHTSTQQFAGYTETLWHPDMPALLGQKDTAVDPQFRQRGLGRWLKAAMIAKVLQDRPQVKRIRTNNANSNAPMRRINEALGFRHYKAIGTWQVTVDAVKQYLSN